jgi:glycosyltransferase involved in cell wall biosynthesis
MKTKNKEGKGYHTLFIVENNQVPQDTRVWLEARALKEERFDVSVICPNIKKEKESHKRLDNIEIFQYNSFFEGVGVLGLLLEYLLSSFLILLYSIKICIRRPFFKVLIIGDGTERESVERIVIDEKLGGYFIFYGSEYNKEKLFSLLSSADVCVEPCRESAISSKSTSIKIMEYMALGKPIIQYKGIEGEYL